LSKNKYHTQKEEALPIKIEIFLTSDKAQICMNNRNKCLCNNKSRW